MGFLTEIGPKKALWRTLSLRPKEQRSTRLEKSKSTAMELKLLDEIPEFRRHARVVALEVPRTGDLTGIDEAEHWIAHAQADVVRIADEMNVDAVLRNESELLLRR
jgi:hypothetical protein